MVYIYIGVCMMWCIFVIGWVIYIYRCVYDVVYICGYRMCDWVVYIYNGACMMWCIYVGVGCMYKCWCKYIVRDIYKNKC